MAAKRGLPGLDDLQNQIISLIRLQGDPQQGLEFETICEALQDLATSDELREHLTRLAEEGHIFNTIGENHFGVTD